jgi:8-oxo-dGTP pyrophosphatase MutT (NUDIX family)
VSETLVSRLRALHRPDGAGWTGRPAAVLLAFSPAAARPAGRGRSDVAGPDGEDDLDVVLVRRPYSMRLHAGQVGFPGGSVDERDADGVAAALREASEEVGLDPGGVEVLGIAGRVPVAVSGFDVELVLGLWDGAGPLVANPREVDAILRPTVRQLADPANHGTLPLAQLVGPERAAARQLPPEAFSPVFHVDGHVVWGFTAGVLADVLGRIGLEAPPLPREWQHTRARPTRPGPPHRPAG